MSIPSINVETMLLGWSRSHNGGSKITLQINDDDLEHFERMTIKKGKHAGQRLMAVFVEIGDDEQPVPEGPSMTVAAMPDKAAENAREAGPNKRGGGKFPGGLCGLAVRWCADREFQLWVTKTFREEAECVMQSPECTHEEAQAKLIVCLVCKIHSRKELDTNDEAAEVFHNFIREPYAAHRKGLGLVD